MWLLKIDDLKGGADYSGKVCAIWREAWIECFAADVNLSGISRCKVDMKCAPRHSEHSC